MSDSTAALSRQINAALKLQSVVRTMKAVAATSISQYQKSVEALNDCDRTIRLGLTACFRASLAPNAWQERWAGSASQVYAAVVFGSDQGLVGRFNGVIADFALEKMAALPGRPSVFAVGERVSGRLTDAGMNVTRLFSIPSSMQAIASVVAKIQIASQASRIDGECSRVYLFHNRPAGGASFEPVSQRLLPLDRQWQRGLAQAAWPSRNLPQVVGGASPTLRGLIREYLFISIFRACAESLASENSSRLAAMERADTNIDELLSDMRGAFHRLRQSSIDEELFDVVAGYESLMSPNVLPA